MLGPAPQCDELASLTETDWWAQPPIKEPQSVLLGRPEVTRINYAVG